MNMKGITEIRVDFSLRREVFHIVIGSIVGVLLRDRFNPLDRLIPFILGILISRITKS
jgi:hypothetical protein